jgi:hypothetical protein
MRAKGWISVLALLGVLAHAAAAVHHATRLTGTALQHRTLLADLAKLCHGGTKPAGQAEPELPFIPQPTDGLGGCQVCCGLGSAAALPAPEGASLPAPPPAPVAVASATHCAPQSHHAACPPARGPPALA